MSDIFNDSISDIENENESLEENIEDELSENEDLITTLTNIQNNINMDVLLCIINIDKNLWC